MIQSGSGLRFWLESRQGLGAPGHVIRQELQSNETMKAGVLGLIHHTHTATIALEAEGGPFFTPISAYPTPR